MSMRVLVACEYSGTVRDAFARKGHDAWSCDLLPTESNGNHVRGNVLPYLSDGWDLIVAHPPCTYLSYAANRFWHQPGRAELRREAMEFFLACVRAPSPRVCVENPVGLPNTAYRKPDQVIDPYYFGESARKRTCLWLKGLKPLWWSKEDDLFNKATAIAPPDPIYIDKNGKRRHFTDAIGNHKGNNILDSPSNSGQDLDRAESRRCYRL